MVDLLASLTRIEAALERLGRDALLTALRPGRAADQSRSMLNECGLPGSESVEALYSWRDGTDTTGVRSVGDIHLFPGFYLLSMEDAVANYRAFVPDRRWTAGWFPLLANGGGDFYVVDLSEAASGAVRHFRIEDDEHPLEFSTIGGFLATLEAAFERGVFYVDSEGYLEMDDLVFAALAAELNPEVAWWVE